MNESILKYCSKPTEKLYPSGKHMLLIFRLKTKIVHLCLTKEDTYITPMDIEYDSWSAIYLYVNNTFDYYVVYNKYCRLFNLKKASKHVSISDLLTVNIKSFQKYDSERFKWTTKA